MRRKSHAASSLLSDVHDTIREGMATPRIHRSAPTEMAPEGHVATRSIARVRRGVLGILERDREFLMVRRAPSVPKGGAWCFPGGHVEPGETARQAVVREMAEELGIEVIPTRRIGAIRVAESRYILVAWRVRHVAGTFVLAEREVTEMRWLPITEIGGISPGLASNSLVAEMLAQGDGLS